MADNEDKPTDEEHKRSRTEDQPGMIKESPRGKIARPDQSLPFHIVPSPDIARTEENETEAGRSAMPHPSQPTNLSPREQFMVAASPPKHMPMEDLLKTAKGVRNMALAHEIIVDNNFKLSDYKPPPESLYHHVRKMAEHVFWQTVEKNIHDDEQRTTQVLNLVTDLKERVGSLLVHGSESLRPELEEKLDLELIKQQVENGCADLRSYGTYVISLMERLCAPIRDEEIHNLKTIENTVEMYKEIFKSLENLHLDMADFTIKSMRPFIQQHSIAFERHQFNEFLQAQMDLGIDGLEFTKLWFKKTEAKLKFIPAEERSASPSSSANQNAAAVSEEKPSPANHKEAISAVNQQEPSSTNQTQAASAANQETAASTNEEKATGSSSSPGAEGSDPPRKLTALEQRQKSWAILNMAYLELLQWPGDVLFPETVLLDEGRFHSLGTTVQWLSLVASVILVTYNTVGSAIAGISGLTETLKDHMRSVLWDVSKDELPEAMKNVSAQVVKDVNDCLTKHGFAVLDEARREVLERQIQAVAEEEHAIRKLTSDRMENLLFTIISQNYSQDRQKVSVPAGLSAVSKELAEASDQFSRIVNHNRNVYGPVYIRIISDMLGGLGRVSMVECGFPAMDGVRVDAAKPKNE